MKEKCASYQPTDFRSFFKFLKHFLYCEEISIRVCLRSSEGLEVFIYLFIFLPEFFQNVMWDILLLLLFY